VGGAPPKLNTLKFKRDASQSILLQDVKKEVQERQEQALRGSGWLNLEMERQDYRVLPPWSAAILQQSQPAVPLDAGSQIIDIFEHPDVDRKLLILGEPGAGKTTITLELARILLERAVAEESEPVPVLLNLSSWTGSHRSIFEWLVSELKTKYGVRQDLAQRWLEKTQLLLLLDGLDEVAPQHQKNCAIAIDAWLTGDSTQRPCGVVICCRREEFEQTVQQKLSLYGAIYLKALNTEQIENYFIQLGLQDVWQTVQHDESLQKLLTTPLFLSMFSLVQKQEKFLLSDWQSRTTSDSKVQYLLDTYWEASITRELIIDPNARQQGVLSRTYGKKLLPEPSVIKHVLVFTAKALNQESQTEFLIERMQPSLLPEEDQRWGFRLLFMLFLLVFVIFSSWITKLVPKEFALLLFTFPWLRYVLTMDHIVPAEKLQFKTILFLIKQHRPVISLALSITSILLTGFGWLMNKVGTGWHFLIVVPLTGVIINMSIAWLFENIRAEITTPVEANQGMKDSWRNILFFVLIVLIFTGLLCFRFQVSISNFADKKFSIQVFLSYIIYIVGFASFEGGGKALIQHSVLRLILAWNCYAPLRYDLMLDYCVERLFLQRVGGRYRFMHRLLQDYFAKMDLN
jgi:DNA polymerase III delta prime subunit